MINIENHIIAPLMAQYAAERNERFASLTACPHRSDIKPQKCVYCKEDMYVNSTVNDEHEVLDNLREAVVIMEKRIGLDPALALLIHTKSLLREAQQNYEITRVIKWSTPR